MRSNAFVKLKLVNHIGAFHSKDLEEKQSKTTKCIIYAGIWGGTLSDHLAAVHPSPPAICCKAIGNIFYIYVILTLQWVTDQAATTPFAATLLGETTPNLYNVEANHPNWNQILAEAPADPPPSSRLSPPS